LDVLARCDAGRSQRDFLAQSSCYVFSNGGVATYNDEVCCRAPTGLPKDFRAAVPGEPLKRVIEAMVDDEIDLSLSKSDLNLVGRRQKAKLRFEQDILLPVDTCPPPKTWAVIPDPDSFREAVRRVSEVCGGNDREFMATCVHVHPEYLEATNNVQAMRVGLVLPISRPFLIRGRTLRAAAMFGAAKIGETESFLHLRSDKQIVSLRRHIADYVSMDELFAFTGSRTDLPKGAAVGAKLASIFSGEDKDNDEVTVSLQEGRMIVSGSGSYGEAEQELEANYHGPDMRFQISPNLLESLVSTYNSCETDGERLIVRGERWWYYTVLGRIRATSQVPSEVSSETPQTEEAEPAEPAWS
jgi:hypothetical protein